MVFFERMIVVFTNHPVKFIAYHILVAFIGILIRSFVG